MRIKCPAKLNLYLNTVKKNSDGFHDLQSIFHTIELSDYVVIQPAKKFSFSLSSKSSIPFSTEKYNLKQDNFVQHVFDFFQSEFQIPPVKIEIEKHIPVGAGLGGGSSNIAGCFIGINRFFDLNLRYSQLLELSQRFGSDVSFFIKGGMAFVTGRGELIETCPFALNSPVVVIYPDLHISTKQAYTHNNTLYNPQEKSRRSQSVTTIPDFDLLKKNLIKLFRSDASLKERRKKTEQILKKFQYNSFQKKTIMNYPDIRFVFREMEKISSQSLLLSGSGSSIFSAYHDKIFFEKIFSRFTKYRYVFDTRFSSKGAKVVEE